MTRSQPWVSFLVLDHQFNSPGDIRRDCNHCDLNRPGHLCQGHASKLSSLSKHHEPAPGLRDSVLDRHLPSDRIMTISKLVPNENVFCGRLEYPANGNAIHVTEC